MCHPVICSRCSKTTWTCCGRHVDDVMSKVPRSQQCSCSPDTAAPARNNVFRSLFRR
ncbi:hypothetical protein CH292_25720 [Rhodococcus sp. 14-2470-1a]|nr:hypothetical protein CH292_25720 [Rhodococcus sp. 14-2470-1a]